LQINKLYAEGKTSDGIHALSQGPDDRARVFNRCFINGFLFRTAQIEKNLSTQNSGVVVRGDGSAGDINWYGVVKKIYALDFPTQKEVILFECNWYDVPATSKSKGRGFKRDQYGIIDIDASRLRYLNDPYILGAQAEQVFYVKGTKRPDLCTVITMKPRNLFAMPDSVHIDNEGEIDVDSLDVRVEDMIDSCRHAELTNWTRSGIEGVTGDASIIKKAHADSIPEPPAIDIADDEEDDTSDDYIDDGYVAPVNSNVEGPDCAFFI
jgi:hypothetical protein